MRVADYVADWLVANGINNCFSVVGGGAMHLNDALGHKDGLKVTYNHHEQACAMAAEGYARGSGRIASVCVTTGPGGTNALTGVLGAWLDSIPMLVISGQVKYHATIASTDVPLRQLGDQEFNIVDCVSCMTKYAVMVVDQNDIAYHLERALFLASNGRPGPVWLDIPLDVQAALIDPDQLRHYDPSEDAGENPVLDLSLIGRLLCRIAEAKRPVVLAGGGIRTAHASASFLKVVDKLGVPVVTVWNSHDLLPDDHPLYCGRQGPLGGNRGGNFVVQNADMLISFACQMNVRQTSYNWENFAPRAFKAAVDIDDAELRKPTLLIDLPICADVNQVFAAILEDGEYRKSDWSEWISWCRYANEKYPVVLPEYMEKDKPVNPYVFLEELSKKLQAGACTVASNGTACVVAFQAFRIKPRQRLFTNSGCASMGYGLPAAIGASIGCPGQSIVCLEGDGSIMMNLQELQTLKTNCLDVKVFILNNDGYHSIRQTQTNHFAGNFCGIGPDSGDLGFPDFAMVANAFGIPFTRIERTSDVEEILTSFLRSSGPALCEVLIDKEQFFAPKLSSKKMPDGSIVSPSLEDMYPFLPQDELDGMRWQR